MNYFIKKWGAKTLERPEWGPVGEIACFEGYFQQMWQKSLNCPYLCTVKYAVLTLSRMAFIMASSSSFCRLIATILASCSLRWRAKSIISSSVISEDDSDRCTKSPMNTSIFMGSILWSVFYHPILSLTVGSGVVLSLLFAFFSQCHRWQTRWRRLALKERAKKFCWHGLSGKMLQRSHKSWPTGIVYQHLSQCLLMLMWVYTVISGVQHFILRSVSSRDVKGILDSFIPHPRL